MSININKSLNQLQTAVGSLFINSVTDLIRGIRSHKEDEAQYINQAIQEIKQNEISSQDKDIKVQAIEKLTYVCSNLTILLTSWLTYLIYLVANVGLSYGLGIFSSYRMYLSRQLDSQTSWLPCGLPIIF